MDRALRSDEARRNTELLASHDTKRCIPPGLANPRSNTWGCSGRAISTNKILCEVKTRRLTQLRRRAQVLP